jgi:hypothetical protein
MELLLSPESTILADSLLYMLKQPERSNLPLDDLPVERCRRSHNHASSFGHGHLEKEKE